jgi:HEAT repeat protein
MDASFLDRIRRLITDLDVDNRIYALVQLDFMIPFGGPDAGELTKLLEAAKSDRSPDVAARAEKISGRLAKQAEVARREKLAGAPFAEAARHAAVAEGAPDPERVRAGIARRFGPWLERLGDHLRDGGATAHPEAIPALAAFAWPRSVPALAKAAEHQGLALAAVDALARIGGAEAQAALKRIAKSGPPETRVAALDALGRCGLAEAPAELLEPAGTPGERRAQARALGAIGGASAMPRLVAGLEDPEPEVILESVKGLGHIADPSTAQALARASYSRDSRVRATVASALARIVVPAAEGTLRALLRDIDARVRANASDAILCFHQDRATMRRFYATLLNDEHHRVRSNALVTLWPFNNKASYAALLKLIGSETIVERSSGYWAAGKLGEEPAVRVMLRRLGTEDDQRGVEQGLVALEVLDRKELMTWVRKTLGAPWPRIRLRACRVLTTVGDPGAAPDLKRLAGSETDPKVLAAALRALAELAPEEAAPLAQGDPAHAELRAVAISEGLLESDPERAASHVGPFLDDPAPAARARAIAAMVLSGDLGALGRLEALYASHAPAAMEALDLIGRRLGPSSLERAPALAKALAAD